MGCCCFRGNSNGAFGGFYRRIKARPGAPKAITATAHKLARIFYRMWATGRAYERGRFLVTFMVGLLEIYLVRYDLMGQVC